MRKEKVVGLVSLSLLLVFFLAGCGCVNKPPTANITSPNDGSNYNISQSITFEGRNSEDPDGDLISYNWDFGDGNDASGQAPVHQYESAGTYEVRLTVTDDDGTSDTASITVNIESEEKSPNAYIFVSPASGTVPLKVNFDASDSSDPDGNIVSYNWDFGDGNIGSGQTTNYTYNNSGAYDATLTVVDNDGDSNTASTTINVSSAPPENKDVILSLAQGRPVSYGEWFKLKIDGYGNRGQVDILHNGNVTQIRKQTLASWRVNISRPSSNRISVEFRDGGNDSNIRGIVKLKMSGNGESQLELTNAQVFSDEYEMNIMRLIGTTIK